MVLNNLSLDSLRTLVITQDLGGFGRASERLGRTPSAISLQMKRLQEEVGVPLFRKQGRKTLLTEQGEIALRYARRVLELNDEMIDTLRGSSLAGVVRIGFAQDFTVNVLPLVIARFNALYPLVKLEVTVDRGPGTPSSDRLWRPRSCTDVRRRTEKDGAPVERAAVALDRKPKLQGSRTAAVTACSLQPPMPMSDAGAGGTG